MQAISIESLHLVGLVLLVYQVLPNNDVTSGVLLFCATGVVPAFLQMFNKPRGVEATKRRTRDFVLDSVALVLFFSALLLWPLLSGLLPIGAGGSDFVDVVAYCDAGQINNTDAGEAVNNNGQQPSTLCYFKLIFRRQYEILLIIYVYLLIF